MSIRVQCPNPDCEITHKVKNKYAGMLCKCPACGSAMLVPKQKPAASDSAPPGGLRGFGASESAQPAAAATDEDDLAAFMAAVEEESEPAVAVEEDEEAEAVAEEDQVAVAVEEEEEAVVAEEEDEEEAVVADEEDFFAAEEAVEEEEEPAPKKAKGKKDEPKKKGRDVFDDEDLLADELLAEEEVEAAVEDEEVVAALEDEEEEPAPKKGKGKKDEPKKKSKHVFDDEDVFADELLAEEEVEAAVEDEEEEPAPKKGKGKDKVTKDTPKKKGKNVFEDEDVLADELLAEEEEEPAPKKGKGKITKDEPKKKGRRMLDEDEDADFAEDEEEGAGKPAGGLNKIAAVLMVLGILGAAASVATPYLDLWSTNGVLPAGATTLKNHLPEDAKMLCLIVTLAGAVLPLLGLLLAWRGRGYGVVSLALTYLGWFAAVGFTILMAAGHAVAQETIKQNVTGGKMPAGLISMGPGLMAGLWGAGAAAVLFPIALLLVHRRTWARVVLLLLVGGALVGCIMARNAAMEEQATRQGPARTAPGRL